jgi:hypothetical protein
LAGLFHVSYRTIALYDRNGAALSEAYDGTFEATHVTTGATLIMRAEAAANNDATRAASRSGADVVIDRLRAFASSADGVTTGLGVNARSCSWKW